MNEHIRLASIAQRFLDAANALSQRPRQNLGFPVPHYLAAHALELALKSHLAHRRATEPELKRIGHNLKAALARSARQVQEVVGNEGAAAIRGINPYYSAKELEYSAWGGGGRLISVPEVHYLIGAAERLLQHLLPTYRSELRAKQPARGGRTEG
jgi:hypothetical protein